MPKVDNLSIPIVDNIRLLIWEMTESTEEMQLQLSDTELQGLENKVSEKRKREFLGVRLALKELLGNGKTIKYDANGKPFLADESFHIGVSHSGKWITVMVHSTRNCGIDIEIPTDKINKIYNRFLGETEQIELSNGQDVNQLQLAWSAKEALYKIIGAEAVDFAKQLRLFPFEVQQQGEILAEHIPTTKKYTLQYFQHSAFIMVYCVD